MPDGTGTGIALTQLLLFLGFCFGLAVGALLMVWGWVTQRRTLARRVFVITGGGAVLYIGALAVASLASRDRLIGAPGEKYICELDCHLAYTVAEARKAPVLRTADGQSHQPRGTYWVVSVRTRFDSATISPRRPRQAPLFPNPRRVALIDEEGREHLPERSLSGAALGLPSTPITTRLRPGESYTTVYVFDLPSEVLSPRLLVAEDLLVNRLMIGHERSLGHARTLLGLPAVTAFTE